MRVKNSIQFCFKRQWRFGLVLIGAMLVLAGCNLPVPLPPPPAGGGPSTCTPEELTSPPRILGPSEGEVVDTLSPTFIWDWSAACNPEEFLVEVFSATRASPPISSWRVPGHSRGSVMFGTLQPATTYMLRVTPSTTGGTGPRDERPFMTGPLCMDVLIAADYPAPILLAPPDGTVFSEFSMMHTSGGEEIPTVAFVMAWDDPSLCNPTGYQVEVSTSPTFPADRTWDASERPWSSETSQYFFFPPPDPESSVTLQDCTRYYWHVRAVLSDTGYAPYEYGPYSDTWSFEINTNSIMCTTIGVSPIPPEIPLPGGPPIARALQNTNCRSGPSRVYEIDSTLFQGQSAPIQGRNADNTWWLIQDPLGGKDCWVWGGAVETTGDLSAVLVVQAPPTPKPSKPEQAGKSGCWIKDNMHPNGYCAPRACGPNDSGGPCNP